MNAQQLKNSILQEAIEGRLVPQDPNDEPASVLLDKIRKEKARLVKEGKLKKKDIEVLSINEEEIPYKIPNNWVWCRLKEVCDDFIVPQRDKPTCFDGDIPWCRIEDIEGKYLNRSISGQNVSMELINKMNMHICPVGTVISACSASIGAQAIVTQTCCTNQTFIGLVCNKKILFNEYLYYFLMSQKEQLRKKAKGTTIGYISRKKYEDYVFPIPPLAEQHRIVAKIEELLPKVEEYGKAQEALDKLNSELPEKLKKSILQEAITGQLVPQDPNDEPASVLLDKIRKEKARLVKEGKLKKKDLDEIPINEDEKPFQIPDSWEWCRLSDYLDVRDGTHDSPKYYTEGIPFVTSKNLDNGKIDFSTCKFISEEDHKKFSERSNVEDGDILFAMIGSIGKPVIVKKDKEFSIKNIALFKRYNVDLTSNQYLYYYLLFIQNELIKISSGGVQSFVGLKTFREWVFPLPPLAEQHRIVAKIEELFAEIDKLKV